MLRRLLCFGRIELFLAVYYGCVYPWLTTTFYRRECTVFPKFRLFRLSKKAVRVNLNIYFSLMILTLFSQLSQMIISLVFWKSLYQLQFQFRIESKSGKSLSVYLKFKKWKNSLPTTVQNLYTLYLQKTTNPRSVLVYSTHALLCFEPETQFLNGFWMVLKVSFIISIVLKTDKFQRFIIILFRICSYFSTWYGLYCICLLTLIF